ncbi:hypothetical protein [Yersinia intermedia]|uniref:lipase family alpha/beta hydrolase n=1 Tax=Yersinia intermedia TaxID=631 RepID=UPI0030D29D53
MNDALGNNVSSKVNDDNGFHYYGLEQVEKQKNAKAIIYKTPTRVIPVLFLPGVMGTNLMDGSGKSVWRLNNTLSTFGDWGFRGAEKRKRLLDPHKTFVDPNGSIDLEFYNEVGQFSTRRSRGWGEIGYMSYGEFLPWLQKSLNDNSTMENNRKSKNGKRTLREKLIDISLNAEFGEGNSTLTEDDVEHSYKYLFPLEVVGYNWLQSNDLSANILKEKIKTIVDGYNSRNMLCDKVILVTHSMGGFVARHYSELLNGSDNILGVVHGVMPTLGSPMAYKRMKAGESGGAGLVIGSDGAQMTSVLAQSPGPLQLLPGKRYGMGWLQIEGISDGLPVTDPFEEIYKERNAWWCLCEDRFINPEIGKIDKIALDAGWDKYLYIIEKNVQTFIENLDGKFHKNTYAFYGNDGDKYPSFGKLNWKGYIPGYYDRNHNQNTSDVAYRGIIYDPHNSETSNIRTAYFVSNPDSMQWKKKSYIISAPSSSGDGTVPVEGAKFTSNGLKTMLGVGVDHEGAFKNSDTENARLFTLRAIIKISQEVNNTKLAYHND